MNKWIFLRKLAPTSNSLNWFFRLEPPSGIILSVTELIPETFNTNRDDMNMDRDSNPESSSQRNVTEDDRENQNVFY